MRELICERLDSIKKIDNFSQTLSRWRDATYPAQDGKIVSFAELDYRKLSDESLLQFFEVVLRKHSIQM